MIEGIIIACYAVRAQQAFVYIRGEAVHAIRRVTAAVQEARLAGYLGIDILDSGFNCDIVVHAGAGAYICGEETALLDSLEGRRGQPRLKPPFPATNGLYDAPTVVNNVGTLASVPYIVLGGADWYKALGPGGLARHVDLLAVRTGEEPRPVRGADGHDAARAARARRWHEPRQGHQVLDARWRVLPAAHRRAPRPAAGLRLGRQGRLDERHLGRADLRRGRLRRARRAQVVGVLPPRVVRQVHARAARAPTGTSASTTGSRPARAPKRISRRCSTCPTTSSAGRSARSATARPARCRPRSSTSATSTSPTSKAHGCPFAGARTLAGAH